jgi:hypothetical protein
MPPNRISKRPPSKISSSPTILPYYQNKEGDIFILPINSPEMEKI